MRKNMINISSASANNIKIQKQKSLAQPPKTRLNQAIDLALAIKGSDQRKTNVSVLQKQIRDENIQGSSNTGKGPFNLLGSQERGA